MADSPPSAASQVKAALVELASSKKFIVGVSSTIAALIARASSKWNLGIDPDMAAQLSWTIVSLAGLYLASQGAADFGKHAAEAAADAHASKG